MLKFTREDSTKKLVEFYTATEDRKLLQFQRLKATAIFEQAWYLARCAIGALIPTGVTASIWDTQRLLVRDLVLRGHLEVDDYPWFCQVQSVHDELFRIVRNCRLYRGRSKGEPLSPEMIDNLNDYHRRFADLLGVQPTFNLERLANVPLEVRIE
jgi:hypothetical protein